MKRLSSDKAKKILEFLIRKKLGIDNVDIRFTPYFSFGFPKLNEVEVDILYSDGKGKTSPLIVEYYKNVELNISHVTQMGLSFVELFRWMEKQTQREAVFKIDGIVVFTKSDTAETALIEMELEGNHGN